MKKILILLGCTTLLCACRPSNPRIEKCTYVPYSNICEFEYNGHQYIQFKDNRITNVVHNPDCPCN